MKKLSELIRQVRRWDAPHLFVSTDDLLSFLKHVLVLAGAMLLSEDIVRTYPIVGVLMFGVWMVIPRLWGSWAGEEL